MPTIASGSNATITVAAGQILTVQSDGATFDYENPVGTRVGEYSCDSVFGPFAAGGSVKITSVQGAVYYELGTAQASNTSYNPSNVAITGGAIGSTPVSQVYADPASRAPITVGPVKVVTLGASITNGSNSSNAGTLSYSPMLGKTASNRRIDRVVANFGYPGQTASYIYSQISNALAVKPDLLILGPDFGTNSALASATDGYAEFGQYVILAKLACRAAGVRMAACTTLPQGASSSATTHKGIRSQNLWLTLMAAKLGVDVIDVHAEMLDQSTGYLSSSYDGGDGIHPNDVGHAKIGSLIATWIDANLTQIPWPVGVGTAGLTLNPLMLGTTSTNWNLTISPSTFAGTTTHSLDPRVDATDLPAGQWHKTNCDATSAGGALRTGCTSFAATAGETLLIFGYIKSAGTGTCSAIIWSVGSSSIAQTIVTPTNGAASVPFCLRYVVPTTGNYSLGMNLVTTVGQNLTGWIGALDAIRVSSFTNGQ
jgi:lysophospholipase L1-like esterase